MAVRSRFGLRLDGRFGQVYEMALRSKAIRDAGRIRRSRSLTPDVKGALRFFALPELATAAHVIPAFEAIRLPPRQLVLYTRRIKALITTREFGALRYTRQLGFTHLVYPGAQGTRFEHSLGVYDLACRFIMRLVGYSEFRKIYNEPRDVLIFLLAALLHDIGHFPFAHQLEEFRREDFPRSAWRKVEDLVGNRRDSHTRRGIILVREKLREMIQTLFEVSEEDIESIATLAFSKKDALTKASFPLKLLHTLINGPVDLDKLDYVERDAHHCGVPYGNYLDVDRLLETMRIVKNSRGIAQLAFNWRAVGSLEQLATARHEMYANVYWHRAVRSATTMFKHAFFLLQEQLPAAKLKQLFFDSGSDDAVLAAILGSKELKEVQNVQIAKAIERLLTAVAGRERNLYKEVWEDARDKRGNAKRCGLTRIEQRRTAVRIFNGLLERRMLSAASNELGEHNVLLDCHTDTPPHFERVQIQDPLGPLKRLEKVAPSVRQLRRNFEIQACRLRIFVNEEVLVPEYQGKMARAKVRAAVQNILRKT